MIEDPQHLFILHIGQAAVGRNNNGAHRIGSAPPHFVIVDQRRMILRQFIHQHVKF